MVELELQAFTAGGHWQACVQKPGLEGSGSQVPVIQLICRKCRGSLLIFQGYALYQLKVEKKEKDKSILLYTSISLTEL